ncbi:uncharacterized protein EI90DRAFT_861188 [Cantharellus anzutake]|uniref:uncharacterized protein n=1 Tax=Cantharellus anzutake TaxID=1750568 RepID=UPI001903FC05|nr:uncharacterized protein EI90DRAFT_861188 [Cantharellus anzutake]KAF8311917.1 hypothetical protein EI90DRAFT_861188 [Cantharellus anzutake]
MSPGVLLVSISSSRSCATSRIPHFTTMNDPPKNPRRSKPAHPKALRLYDMLRQYLSPSKLLSYHYSPSAKQNNCFLPDRIPLRTSHLFHARGSPIALARSQSPRATQNNSCICCVHYTVHDNDNFDTQLQNIQVFIPLGNGLHCKEHGSLCSGLAAMLRCLRSNDRLWAAIVNRRPNGCRSGMSELTRLRDTFTRMATASRTKICIIQAMTGFSESNSRACKNVDSFSFLR